jgi:hypothetical protein
MDSVQEEGTTGYNLCAAFKPEQKCFKTNAARSTARSTASDICRRAAFGDACDQHAPVNIDKQQQQEPQ